MRLNGKRAIMEYLGRDARNWRSWQQMKMRYGRIIYTLDRKQHHPRYWTMSEWLNQVDLDTGYSLYDAEGDKLVTVGTAQTYTQREAKRMKRERRELVPV